MISLGLQEDVSRRPAQRPITPPLGGELIAGYLCVGLLWSNDKFEANSGLFQLPLFQLFQLFYFILFHST